MKNRKLIFIVLSFLIILVSIKIIIDIYIQVLETETELQPYDRMSIDELKFKKKKIEKKLFFNPFSFRSLLKMGNINHELIIKGENSLLSEGVRNLKLTVVLNRNGLDISINGIRKLLFLWNKISAKDKLFCSSIFADIINVINENELNSIIDIWQQRSKDISFFEKTLFIKPVFFKNIADRLIYLKKYLKERWVFLSNYEIYYLAKKSKEFYTSFSDPLRSLKQKEIFLQDIVKNIKGYYRLSKSNRFSETTYLKLLSDLYLDIIESYASKIAIKNPDEISLKFIEYTEEYLKNKKFPDRTVNLEYILGKYDFFRHKGQKVLYIKNLIHFENKEFSKVIKEINDFFKTRVEVDLNLYENFVFLLIDSCISDNLYFKAEGIIDEYKTKIGNKDKLYQRISRINKSLKWDPELSGLDKLNSERYKKSFHFEFTGEKIEREIFLSEREGIFIKSSNKKMNKTRDLEILQIFINNKIRDEIYIKDISDLINYKMPQDEFISWDCWKVKLRLAGKRRI